jgi:glucose-6-phosphate 1-dehydrogenase
MIIDSKCQPTLFVIFGGTGDLNSRKLAPALYNLFLDNWLPAEFSIIGTGRTKYTDEDYRKGLMEDINQFSRTGKVEQAKWDEFSKHIVYQVSDLNQPLAYEELSNRINQHEAEWKKKSIVIFYLAVSPHFFKVIAENIAAKNLADDVEHTRLVIEKPFGNDYKTAADLNKLLGGLFDEKQIYRIDHYLGKETVQNILAFRFANSIFEPIWNRNYIEYVQISVTEKLGVEERGDYYEGSGALRDMVQNHILQLLCLVAMEAPVNFEGEEVRSRKVDVLRAMRKFSGEDVRKNTARGQYGEGWIQGKHVPGYREEPKVNPESNTETFAAIKFFVDNWRWQNVPFYVRTGKRMHESASVITIQLEMFRT